MAGTAELQATLNDDRFCAKKTLWLEHLREGANLSVLASLDNQLSDMMDLKSGDHVLDLGSGSGGPAFQMIEKYSVKVTGVDLANEPHRLSVERAKAKGLSDRVEFILSDFLSLDYDEGSFDAVHIMEGLLYVSGEDKKELVRRCHRWLKPGGQLGVTVFTLGVNEDQLTKESRKHLEEWHWKLSPGIELVDTFRSCGFVVTHENLTDSIGDVYKSEIRKITENKEALNTLGFSDDFCRGQLNGLNIKRSMFQEGQLSYMFICGTKT